MTGHQALATATDELNASTERAKTVRAPYTQARPITSSIGSSPNRSISSRCVKVVPIEVRRNAHDCTQLRLTASLGQKIDQ